MPYSEIHSAVGVVRCAKHGHEDLGLEYLDSVGMHHGNGLDGVIHKELNAARVGLGHGVLQAPGPDLVFFAELAVLVRLNAAP